MIARIYNNEKGWIYLSLGISLILVYIIYGAVWDRSSYETPDTFLGLNLFLEILVFFILNIFVVFGIKGFSERYSRKTSNLVLVSSGLLMIVAVFGLSYFILFSEL